MRHKLLAGVILLAICFSMLSVQAAGQNETGDEWDWEWMGFAGLGVFMCFIPIVAIIIAIAIGVWMYRDAERRGENGALWLIIGIIGGIIGLIIWLIVRPDIGGKKTERHGDRHCPSCGRNIPFDAKVCPYCGADVE
jgi:4-amino-4-deoxy-L-arabinose transferase-like glycosyltransferase